MREVPKEYIVRETDIREKEGIFVHTPSPFAKENLYYVQLEALYTCGPKYDVQRTGLEAFLLFYIREGEMFFSYEGHNFTARGGDVVFLDCRRPHRYRALTRVRFYWFHFDGGASRAYFEHFIEGWKAPGREFQEKGILFRDYKKMEENFVLLHDLMRSDFPDEGTMSVQVHQILALLYSSVGRNGPLSDGVARAKAFMDDRYMEKLSTEEIAEASRWSQSHLFRVFREETGLTPYGYLMNVRMNHAMKMLLETPYTVEEIAEYCAFCSSANFIRAFRQTTGTTPKKFRRLINGVTSVM